MAETFVQNTDDVVRFLTDQHNLIKDLFDEVLGASGTEAREEAFADLRQLLAVHETAEEMVLHPRARATLDGGDEIVDARLEEEHQAKQVLSQLEKMDGGSAEFIDALTEFRDLVLEHAAHEEAEEFGALQQELSAADLKRMVGAVQAAEAIAPTHPHAGVESAKANFALGPFVSMLDRARDLIGAAFK
ncbi:hemerythrin domain-containing protein [Mycolicibacterium phlei]|uniref:hemerythrin domain-containing protein n=1 Tax=Mycolicibacterium phlei TaxID=1771 RepID=UPI0037C7314B